MLAQIDDRFLAALQGRTDRRPVVDFRRPGKGVYRTPCLLQARREFLHETVGELPRHERSFLRIFGEIVVL